MGLSMRFLKDFVDWIKLKLMLLCLLGDYFLELCKLLKQAGYNLNTFSALVEQFAVSINQRKEELRCASDKQLVNVYLAKDSTKMDMCLVMSYYYRRHGVPIYLDIAIDATEFALTRSAEPEVEDPEFQEAFFHEMYKKCRDVYIKKVPFSS